jgi:lycopene cyclase domain-containing protein
MRGEYLLLLTASFVSVVILDRVARLGLFRQWRRQLVALVPTTAVILAWDLLGVARWNWTSNKAVLLGPYGFGGRVPLEEFLFPIVVAACALTLWELIGTRLRGRRDRD